MFSLLKKITMALVVASIAPFSFALEINQNNYEVYIGDVDGDGDGDYYFKQKPWTLILYGDISTPLLLKGTRHFVVYNNAGVLSAPQSFTLADADLTNKINSGGLRLATLGSDIFSVSSGSGQNTLLIRGATASTPALLITSYSNLDIPAASDIRSYSTNNFIGISDRNVQLQITDINGDGLNDVLLTDSSSQYAYLNEYGTGPNRYFEVTPSTAKPIADATHVGTTAGQFRVDESGAATYSIPIGVPDGIAGVKPQISLNYSSNAGPGIAGRGWSLGGLSSISRCRQTLSQDNNPQPITWSATDRFCLDGQRLILTSGTYGSADSTYKTEIDSVVEVKAVGGLAGHPDKFEVRAKDGSITTYGATGTSLSEVSGSTTNPSTTILTWSISRFRDNMGNAIEFEYDGDALVGQRIKNIFYAYNSLSSSPTPRLATGAQARVEFLYSNRSDRSSAYVGGYQFGQTMRLNNIVVYNSSVAPSNTPVLQELRRYHLNYLPTTTIASDNRGVSSITRLESIQECSGAACYSPIQFGWGAGNKIIYTSPIIGFNAQPYTDSKPILQTTFADVTGDGRQDLIYAVLETYSANESAASVAIHVKSENHSHRTYLGSVNRYSFKMQALDYNGDGRQDLAVYVNSQWKLYLSTPVPPSQHWVLKESNFNISLTEPQTIFADINSDGLADAITSQGYRLLERDETKPLSSSLYYKFGDYVPLTLSPNNVYVTFQQPFNTNEPNLSDCVIQPNLEFSIENRGLADFNGDGVTDFIGTVVQSMKCQDSFIQNYNPTVTRTRIATYAFVVKNNQLVQFSPSILDQNHQAMDVNGDGLTDLVITTKTGNDYVYKYRMSNGNGFESAVAWRNMMSLQKPQLTDYNGDGSVDIIWKDYGGVYAWLGSQLGTVTIGTGQQYIGNANEVQIADVSGDGVGDLIVMAASKISAYYGEYVLDAGQTQRCYVDYGTGGQVCTTYPQHTSIGGGRQSLSIVSIANGTGAITNINYGTLSNSGRYKTTEVNAELQTSGGPLQCYTGGNGELAYCSGGYTYSYDLSTFYTKLNGGWDLPTGSTTLVPGNANKGNPVLEINGSMMVVTAVESNAPAANDSAAYAVNQQAMSKVDYHYGEAKMQASGRGFLGFAKLKTVDAQTGVTTVSFYRQDFPFIGSPISTTVYSSDSTSAKILSHAYNNWDLKKPVDGKNIYLPYLKESIEKTYDADSSTNPVLQTIVVNNTYDDFANLTKAISTTSGSGISSTQTVVNSFGSTIDEKIYGRISQAQVTTSRNDGTTVTKTSNFTYYPKEGDYKFLLSSEEIVGGPKTTYYYDLFGNKTQVSVEAKNSSNVLETRNTFNSYSTDGRYLVSTRNDLSQSAQITSRNEYGQAVSATDANSVSSGTTYYDAMGNQYMQKNADGSWTRTESRWCSTTNGIACPAGAVYRIYSRASGGSKAYEYFDKLGRTIRSSKLGFNGNWSIVDTEYDNLSRVKRQSNPFFSNDPTTGQATAWTVTSFDNFGRPTKVTTPDGAESTLSYEGYTTTSTNALGQIKKETKNGLGQLVKVEDALQGTIEYEYDVYGGLLKATTKADGKSISVRMCYDDLGRKTAMLDPDKGGTRAASGDLTIDCQQVLYKRTGWWTYKYNGFGELVEQADAKGQTTKMYYDKLGRMIGRVDVKADASIESFTQWFYEKGVNAQATGINGKLTAVVMNSGSNISQTQIDTAIANGTASCVEGNSCFKTLYEFDPLTRPRSTRTYYPGSTTAYSSWIEYDPVIGRVLRQYDPLDQQLTENGSRVISGTQTFYNDFGYVSAVRDIGTGQLISSVTSVNARGQVTEEFRGNGATTKNSYDDLTGNLTNQQAGVGGVWSIQNISYKWDKIGNLKYRKNNSPLIGSTGNKNKQESFCYDKLNRLIKTVANVSADYATGNSACSSQDVNYDGFGNITYKLGVGNYIYSGVNAGPHAVSIAGSASYTYDANGNAITGDGRVFTYTSYDMASRIVKGSDLVEFKYGPDRARWQRTDVKSGSTVIKTIYIGNIEKIETVGGDIEWKRYVGGAIFTYKTNTSNQVQSTDKKWVYNDHLGSVDVITDNAGIIRQSLGFNPWGERRNGENWSAMTPAQISAALVTPGYSRPITTRGYTGHEMVDDMGIIHMNGRIYDAKIARFLQADPFIQAATYTQSYNRYSYVVNNPLNKIDPSGFLFGDLKKLSPHRVFKKSTEKYGLVGGIWFMTTGDYLGAKFADYTDSRIAQSRTASQIYIGAIGIVTSIVCGPCSMGFTALAAANMAYYQSGRDLNVAFKAGLRAGVTSALFYGVNAYYGDAWTMGRVFANGVAGGVSAEIYGGSFEEGFRMSASLALIAWSYQGMKAKTDAYKITSCEKGLSICKYNDHGELLTDGGRGEVPGSDTGKGNFITNGGMANEASGQHLYNENSNVGRFINSVSKTHDWFNSDASRLIGFKGYDVTTGMWWAGGDFYNTTFQFYSFAGMLPAGIYTGAALIQPYSYLYNVINDDPNSRRL